MKYKYWDKSLSPKERALELLNLMTVEEKIGQMMQLTFNMMKPEETEDWIKNRFAGSFLHVLGDDTRRLQEMAAQTRLGIPLIFGIDAIHGHALHNGATVFPSQLAMSCSWNPELIEEAGRVVAKEVSADGIHWTFSPVLCVGRDLRWGRINETFGEDPYLISILAAAIIKGYQGKKLSDEDSILACAKHFIAYGETIGGRDAYDTSISLRKIRDFFLPPFQKAVEAGCATVMASYQSIDGVPVSANKKLIGDILKEELGFNGFVVTDWNNTGNLVHLQKVSKDIHDASKKVIEAGNDMIMHTLEFYDSAVELVKNGTIPETMIDESVKRILSLKFSMGLFDEKRQMNPASKAFVFGLEEHYNTNLKVARESIVLLKNDSNILPLKNNIKKIAVIGPNADNIKSQIGDWSVFTHPDPNPDAVPHDPKYTMLEGIRKIAAKKDIEVVYNRGCDIINKDDETILQALACASEADIIVAVIGDCLEQNGEFKDRADLSLSGAQQKLLESLKSTGKELVVVLVNGKPLALPWVAENADAILETFNSGLLGGLALGEILFGEVNPSGKLSISFPHHSGQLPIYYNQIPGWHGNKYMDMPEQALYNFGYGLSYTSFEYSNLTVSCKDCNKDDTVMVCVDVKNTGARDGYEIVQLYINDVVRSIVSPIKELKGFKKEFIRIGETKTVKIPLEISNLGFVNENEEYVIEEGEFKIMVGPNSRDEVLLTTIIKVSLS